jgi:hypothetical protein
VFFTRQPRLDRKSADSCRGTNLAYPQKKKFRFFREAIMGMILKSVMVGALFPLAAMSLSGGANAALCGSPSFDTLANLAGSSCMVGDKTFSFPAAGAYSSDGFNGMTPGLSNVPASAVGVVPATTTTGPGLAFNGGWVNSSTSPSGDISIVFTVTAPVTSPITDADLQILSGVGTFLDIESFPGTSIPSLLAADLSPHTVAISPGVTTLLVTDDLSIGPAINGVPSAVSIIDKQFSETSVPEPMSLAILGVSLLAMGAIRRRFRMHT